MNFLIKSLQKLSRQLNNYFQKLVAKINSLNVSSYFYRPKIVRAAYLFTLIIKENAVIGTTIPSGRLYFNFKKTSIVFVANCNGNLKSP